eukprot:TRINITY_DN5207_c0_g1_i1.p1 TRINITY_DN5207_c0_g1~~TRINITY_DN5207_c0_g1_i1.p1  ORF type:complete len:2330 (-),score=855.46 TRINITY_DN5207_c0_g1_i1:20-6229(-)
MYLRTSGNNRVEVTYPFETKRWYHLILSHSYSKMEWLSLASSTVKVYVDGKLEMDTKLKYPDGGETTSSFLGRSIKISNSGLNIPQENSFYGQMGMFTFFGEALTTSQILELHILDYNYIPNFQEKDLLSRSGAPSVLFGFHPNLIEGGNLTNLGQYQQAAFPYTTVSKSRKAAAKIQGNCIIIKASDFKDVIHCGFGIHILLPLFYQKVHPTMVNSVLLLTADLISGHPSNQIQMVESQGYQMIGYLLQKLYVQINALTVTAVDKLLSSCSQNAKKEAYTSLLLNFDIWIGTNFAIQTQLSLLLTSYVQKEPEIFRSLFGFQYFLDIVRNYYWSTEESDVKTSLNRTLSPEELTTIRRYLLACIDLMVSTDNSMDVSEVSCFVHLVQDCSDSSILEDVLRVIAILLSKPTKNLVIHLDSLGGLRPFLSLLFKQSEAVKVQTLRVIGRYLEQLNSKTKAKVLGEYLYAFMGSFILTQGTYEALIEILLEDYSPKDREDHSVHSKLVTLGGSEGPRLVNAVMLNPIFKLLESAPIELKQKVVSEFIAVTKLNSTSAAQEFVEQFGWQGWLISLLISHKTQRDTLKNDSAKNQKGDAERRNPLISRANSFGSGLNSDALFLEMMDPEELDLQMGGNELILRLLTNLLRVQFRNKDGWKLVEDTETFACLFTENSAQVVNRSTLTRSIYSSLVAILQDEVIKSDAKSPHIWKNLVNSIGLIYEFIFFPELKRSEENLKWLDFVLVQKVLDLFDFSLRPPSNAHLPKIELASSKGRDIFYMMLRLSLMTLQESHTFFIKNERKKVSNENKIKEEKREDVKPIEIIEENLKEEEKENVLKSSTSSAEAEEISDEEILLNPSIPPSSPVRISPPASPKISPSKLSPNQDFRSSFSADPNEEPTTDIRLENLFFKNVQRIRTILSHLVNNVQPTNTAAVAATTAVYAVSGVFTGPSSVPLQSKEEEILCQRLIWVLSYLLKVIKRSLKNNDTSYVIIVPLVKEILRSKLNEINVYLGQEKLEDPGSCVREDAPISEFMPYFEQLNWKFPLLDRIYSIKEEMEDGPELGRPKSELKECRTDRNSSTVRQHVKKDQVTDSQNKKKIDQECFALFQKQRIAEVERRSKRSITYSDSQRNLDMNWKKVFRSLTHERSCWNTISKQQQKIYWKLDPTENEERMRLRMKRNFYGSDHKEASLAYRASLESKVIDESRRKSVILAQKALEESLESADAENKERGMKVEEISIIDQEEDLLKALSSIKITVSNNNSMGGIEEFEFEDNDLEDSWFVVDQPELTDTVRVPEKIVYSTSCEYVNPLSKVEGRLVLTSSSLHFLVNRSSSVFGSAPMSPRSESDKGNGGSLAQIRKRKDKKWEISEIVDVQKRRYLLRSNAIEILFADHRSYLFDLPKGTRKKLLSVFAKSVTNGKVENSNLSPSELLKKSGFTQKWQRREISNFDYLMALNTFAGRTYNDLTQYPVFPWVIQDYTSPVLDLNAPDTYRDLSKPIGALNEERLQKFLERKEILDDPEIPGFLYGSHYSTIGSVLFFLIRMEPFTTQFLENLQGGKFDFADRMFFSIPNAWQNVLVSPSDVKELIPEFFYMPEFLKNSNGYDMGVKQDGEKLDDVVLPPWASTPEEFIRINREALESEWVSAHLSDWIDLIFGYKQRGAAAEKSNNLFYYLTYEGSVDIDSIEDPIERAGVEAQIANFGQTPTQLLHHPHPKRDPKIERVSLFKSNPRAPKTAQTHTFHTLHQLPFQSSVLKINGDSITAISPTCDILIHKCLSLDPINSLSETCVISEVQTSLPPVISHFVKSPLFVFPEDLDTALLCSKSDSSIRVVDLPTAKVTRTIQEHKEPITCFGISEDSSVLATGSKDCTTCIWDVKKKSKLSQEPKHILRGHDDEVTAVCVSVNLDIVVTGSKDASLNLYGLQNGRLIRSFSHPNRCPIEKLVLSSQGKIVIYSSGDATLHLFNFLATCIKSEPAKDVISDMIITQDGEHLITGGRKIIIRNCNTLESLFVLAPAGVNSIVTLILSRDEDQLYFLTEDKKVVAVRPYLDERERAKSPKPKSPFVSLGMYS